MLFNVINAFSVSVHVEEVTVPGTSWILPLGGQCVISGGLG